MGEEAKGSLTELGERVIRESGLEKHYSTKALKSGEAPDEDKVENLGEIVSSMTQFDEEYDPGADPATDFSDESLEVPDFGADIEAERWETVLRNGLQTFVEFHLGGTQVRGLVTLPVNSDKCIRFFGTCRQNPARTVILERSADKVNTVGQQGGRKRVALVSLHLLAVKGEGKLLGPLDPAAFFSTEWLAHLPASLASSSRSGIGSPAL